MFYIVCIRQGKLYHTYIMFMFQILCIRKGKLYHTYYMFMFQILCIRKKKTVSYLLYVYELDIVYQKKGNCIILTACKYFRSCVSERRKLYQPYNMFMFQIVCIGIASFPQYVKILDFVYQKEGNCIITTFVYGLDFVYPKEGDCIIHTVCL